MAKSYNHIDIIKILNPTYYDSIKLVIITDAFIYRETLSLDDSSFVKSHMADAAKSYFGEKGYNNVYIQNTPHNAIKAAAKYTESIKPEKIIRKRLRIL